MNPAQILRDIETLAREKLDYVGELDLKQRLVEDLQLDSLRLLTLATEVEDHFRVCLDESDEAGLETVGDLVHMVERKLAEA